MAAAIAAIVGNGADAHAVSMLRPLRPRLPPRPAGTGRAFGATPALDVEVTSAPFRAEQAVKTMMRPSTCHSWRDASAEGKKFEAHKVGGTRRPQAPSSMRPHHLATRMLNQNVFGALSAQRPSHILASPIGRLDGGGHIAAVVGDVDVDATPSAGIRPLQPLLAS